jgi:hypothetical protein
MSGKNSRLGCDSSGLVEFWCRFGETYCLAHFLTLEEEAGRSSETSVNSTKLYGITFTYIESQYCALFAIAHRH